MTATKLIWFERTRFSKVMTLGAWDRFSKLLPTINRQSYFNTDGSELLSMITMFYVRHQGYDPTYIKKKSGVMEIQVTIKRIFVVFVIADHFKHDPFHDLTVEAGGEVIYLSLFDEVLRFFDKLN